MTVVMCQECVNLLGLALLATAIGCKNSVPDDRMPSKRACDRGEMVGCSNLGVLYADGTGVAPDQAKAAALYQKACDGGEAASCKRLETRMPQKD